ncbi:flagella assembly protein FlgT [Pseudoalteromonas sp. MMG010]|uniref:flagellar assembly protein FlgT n=1 Tax=Pseudoalteromonas sp. MMG010 TaxID=2822685 RepID=UPI001B3A557B|nr:flagellar assembly protein FlgT [Pseudoalteromonas sp. MMG010]MBQ4831822.1 flagella assembly protein FlgT [Pseudoalteromonas sp. MMG010]
MSRSFSTVVIKMSVAALLIFSISSYAQWFESTGHAQIQNNDVAMAKSAAIKDAITQALVFSGAKVSSVQTLVDGVLTQDQVKISSHGEIQQIEMISEDTKGEVFAITLRLDIFSEPEQCVQSQFNKFIAVTQSQLNNREQARMGQIFDINKSFSKQLYNTLNNLDMTAKPIAYFNSAIKVDKYFSQQFDYSNPLLEEIANRTNAQYVLFAQVTSVATSDKLNNDYAFWQDESYQRHFAIEFTLFNGDNYDQIWQNRYQTHGLWPFDKTDIIDVNSPKFWQSPYGQAIGDLTHTISYDIQEAMACMPTTGKILHLENDKIIINLGKAHGLKKGQMLSIAHHNYMTDVAGNKMPHKITTLNTLKVEQLYQHSAIAISPNNTPLAGIQINDIVEIISPEL